MPAAEQRKDANAERKRIAAAKRLEIKSREEAMRAARAVRNFALQDRNECPGGETTIYSK